MMTTSTSLHIALLAPDLSGTSGWSRYALDLGKALHAQGHRITALVARPCETFDWCEQIPILADDVQYMTNPLRCFLHAPRIRRTLKRLQPDVLHCIYEPSALVLGVPGMRLPPACITLHSTYAVMPLRSGRIAAWLIKRAYRTAKKLIAVSNFTKTMLHEQEPKLWDTLHLEEKITVIHNTIDCSPMHPRSDKRIGAGATVQLMSVGGVKKRKGYVETIQALAHYAAMATKPFHYSIYGATHDPSYAATVNMAIAQAGLHDAVTLHGSVSDETLAKAYDQADVCILLSLQDGYNAEGFGLVLLEANAWGTPVIGTSSGGCPEAVQDGITGYVCDPHDPQTVAKRLLDITERGTIQPADCVAWASAHASEHGATKMGEVYRSLVGAG